MPLVMGLVCLGSGSLVEFLREIWPGLKTNYNFLAGSSVIEVRGA